MVEARAKNGIQNWRWKKGVRLPAFSCRLEKPNWFLLRLPFCKSCQCIPCHARVCCPSICCPCLPFVFLGKQALTGAVALTDRQSVSNISRAQKHNNLGQNYDHWGPLFKQRLKSHEKGVIILLNQKDPKRPKKNPRWAPNCSSGSFSPENKLFLKSV